jgi:hypothetical protein
MTRKYSGRRITPDLHKKLVLLTVANLVFFRNRDSLWAQNRSRETDGLLDLDSNPELPVDICPSEPWSLRPLDVSELDKNFALNLTQLNIPSRHSCSRQHATSLLSILPDFMVLCAAAPPIEQEKSMEIAAQLMMFASLEQYLIFGQASRNICVQAFAWGWTDNTSPDDASVNSSTYLWKTKRAQYIRLLLPRNGISVENQYQNLWINSSPFQFEKNLLDYLILILTHLDVPVLTQLEAEQFTSLSDPD